MPEAWKIYDMEKRSDKEIVSRDPDLFFRLNNSYIALDEAQLVPEIFSALRVAIDANLSMANKSDPVLLKY